MPRTRRFADVHALVLDVVGGPDSGRRLVVDGTVDIGRDENNGLVLHDEQVSGRHARVVAGDTGTVVDDLQSTNGTFVNGRRVDGRAPITPGDQLLLGRSVLQVTRRDGEDGV